MDFIKEPRKKDWILAGALLLAGRSEAQGQVVVFLLPPPQKQQDDKAGDHQEVGDIVPDFLRKDGQGQKQPGHNQAQGHDPLPS